MPPKGRFKRTIPTPNCYQRLVIGANPKLLPPTAWLYIQGHWIRKLNNKMMKTFITQGGEGRGKTNKKRKATKSKGRGLEEGASRALMRQHGEEGCGERG